MADEERGSKSDDPPEAGSRGPNPGRQNLSRRAVLGGAGLVAGGAAVTAVGATVPGVASAATRPSNEATGTTKAEFVAQISQNGGHLIAAGYFNRIVGVATASLFDGQPGEATARYTAYAEGELVSRAVNGPVTVLDVVGALTVFHRREPGASFADPSSFQVGREVAKFDLTLQDVLTVIAPNTGIPTLAGDMKQTSAPSVFGHRGQRLRLAATGVGTRSDATAPVAVLDIAGNIIAV